MTSTGLGVWARSSASSHGRRWLFVAGEGRSGSTLLGALLANCLDGFDCGELHLLWESLVDGRLCSCGEEMARCEVWSEVSRLVRKDLGLPDDEAAADITLHRLRQRALLAPRIPRPHADELELRTATERALEAVTGANTFIDTSKLSSVLWTASQIPRPLVAIHLVRDPRAVAYSWANPMPDPSRRGDPLPRKATWRAMADWLRANVTAMRVLRRTNLGQVRIRYEDLATAPDATLAAIVGELDEAKVVLEPPDRTRSHAIAGNPARHSPREISLDQRWQTEMPRGRRALCGAMTLPLLRRFGYGMWG